MDFRNTGCGGLSIRLLCGSCKNAVVLASRCGKAAAAVLLAGVGLVSQAPAAISIDNFDPAGNDRFANDGLFVGAAHDWSGVGRAANGTWAVMISGNVFLSATHYHPGNGATLNFFPGNDPEAVPVAGMIAGSQRLGGTDLWMGYLSSPLPSEIASYGIMTVPLTEGTFAGSVVEDAFVYMSGISPTVGDYGGSVLTNQAVATNRIEGFIDGLTVSGSTGDAVVLVQNEAGDAGFTLTDFEGAVGDGDSGAPLMMLSDGEWVVAGITWAKGTVAIDGELGPTARNASAYTYVGNHAQVIGDFVAAHPVPEPHSGVLLIVGAGLLLVRRRCGCAVWGGG